MSWTLPLPPVRTHAPRPALTDSGPATGTPEPGGWSSRELLTILDGLNGLDVIGGDVVEVAPAYDTAGETTALAAAEIAHALIELMVAKPVPLSPRRSTF